MATTACETRRVIDSERARSARNSTRLASGRPAERTIIPIKVSPLCANAPERGRFRALRPQAVHRARERDRFPDVMDAADPADGAFQSEPETRMNEGAVLSQIQIPVVGFDRQTFLFDPGQQLVVVVFALRPTDYFAVALWREEIIAKNRARIGWVLFHVERFCFLRIIVDEDGPITSLDQQRFVFGAEVVAPFHHASFALEGGHCIAVVD